MRTARSLTVSRSTCHAPPHHACPPVMHAPCHACPLPHTAPLPCMPPYHAFPPLPRTPPPLWTEFLTHGSENITLPDPQGTKFFQFHAFLGKIWQNRVLAPPGELAPLPWGNPGSATAVNFKKQFTEFSEFQWRPVTLLLWCLVCFKGSTVSIETDLSAWNY